MYNHRTVGHTLSNHRTVWHTLSDHWTAGHTLSNHWTVEYTLSNHWTVKHQLSNHCTIVHKLSNHRTLWYILAYTVIHSETKNVQSLLYVQCQTIKQFKIHFLMFRHLKKTLLDNTLIVSILTDFAIFSRLNLSDGRHFDR